MNDFIITNTPNVEGYIIEEYCGIVYDEYFCPDERSMRGALSGLMKQAQSLGANAIVGLVITVYPDVRGRYTDTTVYNQAYGTAVSIRKAN